MIACTGNLLDSPAEAYVNAVNCAGVMGAGIALAFRRAYPDYFETYRLFCAAGQVNLGSVSVYVREGKPRYIISFPTKRHWRDASRLEDIETGLADLRQVIQSGRIRSVAIPALGCGRGGLEWDAVQPLIRKALVDLEGVRTYVYLPGPGQ